MVWCGPLSVQRQYATETKGGPPAYEHACRPSDADAGLHHRLYAYRQWQDNHLGLKIENYERRLRVYQEVVKMLRRINRDFAPEWDELLIFNAATVEAPFLFHDEIPAYIDEIFSRGNKLRVANVVYRNAAEMGVRDIDEYENARQDLHTESRWFIDQMPIAREKFKVYLHVAARG